jgi:ABC-2 type transport system permease protein
MPDPILRKEMNLRMRERNAFWVPLLYLLTLGFVFGRAYLSSGGQQPWELGTELFNQLSWMNILLVVLMVPIFATGSVTIEREQRTLASLLLSGLTSGEIVRGKLLGAISYVLLVTSASLPLLLLAFLFGGVSLGGLVLHYFSLFLVTVLVGALGVLISTHFKRSSYAIAIHYGLLAFVLTVVPFLAAWIRTIEWNLRIHLLRPVAFASPLFFINENTRGQWPWALVFYGLLTWLAYRSAVNRLERNPLL